LAENEYFQKAVRSARHISSTIAFTKDYESIGVTAAAWQDCHSLVDIAKEQVSTGKILVKNEIPAGIELFADPLIVKVFYNLLDNAVRYGGKITTIRFFVQDYSDDPLIICEDDGSGISAAEKELIFERGFGKNTGLGLAMSRDILAITGITIRENSKPGTGARFEISVPHEAFRISCE
jgi:signal transduction histidine kinase